MRLDMLPQGDEVVPDSMRTRNKRFDVCQYTGCRLFIDDDEFHWDAALHISGDFESDAEKMRYAQAIAKVLSDHADEIPARPSESEEAKP